MKLPKYLYHYTSIESLALILKNRSIRFYALDNVDDVNEGVTSDLSSIGQWFLVSCWTDNPTESIPLWNMYSSRMKGVRIQLPVFPYDDEYYQENGEYSVFDDVVTDEGRRLEFLVAYPKEKLYQIEYISQSKDTRLLPKKTIGTQVVMDFKVEDIGRYKYPEWNFQKEWRYKIFIIPKDLVSFHKRVFTSQEAAFDELKKIFSQKKGLISYHDMKISESALDALEILTAPLCDDAEYEIIDALTRRHARNAKTTRSQLKIRK